MKSADESLPRTGFGYDVHRLKSGRKLILGGVDIPFAMGLDGHSDADVVVHAITDALLGAAALGDIGKHFPNTDPRYLNISSLALLNHVAALLDSQGFALINVDATLILEQPKILPYVDLMRERIAAALGVQPERISLKATTGEEMGFVGRGEGAAAHAVATIVRR